MDEIEDLPTNEEEEEEVSQEDEEILDKHFGKEAPKSTGWTDTSKWKIVGGALAAFLALSNPWVRDLISKIPRVGGNNMTELLASLGLFLVIMIVVVFLL
jgi:uncharacterized membrane protein